MKKEKIYYLLPAITILFVILAMFVLSSIVNSEIIAPSPKLIFLQLIEIICEKNIWKAIFMTFFRALFGFAIAFLLALVLSIFSYLSIVFKKLLYPIVLIMRATPTMSIILLCLIWLRSDKSPIAISFIVIFPMLYSSILGVLEKLDKSLFEMAKVYNIKKTIIIYKIALPSVFNGLFAEFTSILSFNIKLTIAGESLAYTSSSIGREMYSANINFETARLLALTVIAIILAFLLEIVLKFIKFTAEKIFNGYNSRKIKKAIWG